MLNSTHLHGFNANVGLRLKLIDAITRSIGTTNLKLCVDVGDSDSLADGDADTDLVDLSPEGNNMLAGSAVGADTEDPVFSGTIGAVTDAEFVTMDGIHDTVHSDIYRFDTNPAWLDTLHKDSAIFTFGFIFQLFEGDGGSSKLTAGNCVNSSDHGIRFGFQESGTNHHFIVNVGSGSEVLLISEASEIVFDTWQLGIVSVNEPAGTGFMMVNEKVYPFTSTYVSPGTTAPGDFAIGHQDFNFGLGATTAVNSKFAAAFAYQARSLSVDECRALYDLLFERFHFGN